MIHPQQETGTAVARLMERFKEKAGERVTVLERMALCLKKGALSQDLRQEAEHAAHKLAGSAGTFGFTHGSELALTLEHLCHPGMLLGQEDAIRISELVAALRWEFEQPPK